MGDHEAPTKYTFASRILHVVKAIIAVVGGVAVFVSQMPDVTPFIPETWRPYVGGGLIVVTGLATWYKANAPLVEHLGE
jgi:hypothetical protein